MIEELAARVRGEVRLDQFHRQLYATDASLYQIEPLGVVFPHDAEDLAAICDFARTRGVPLLPRGGGTSLAGQTVGRALVVDCSRHMNRILRVDPDELTAEVESGVVLGVLNSHLAQHGLWLPLDPATADHACIGGMVGNNSSGARSLRYGKTVDRVVELSLHTTHGEHWRLREHPDLPDDLHRQMADLARRQAPRILERFPRILRRVSGYNLDELLRGLEAIGEAAPRWTGPTAPEARQRQGFSLAPLVVGSEGTLGIVSSIQVQLARRAPATALRVIQFDTLEEALEANLRLLEHQPSAIELLDRLLLRQARAQLGVSRDTGWIEGDPEAVLAVEFEGTPDEVRERAEKAFAKGRVMLHQDEQQAVWRVRKAGLGLLMGLAGKRRPVAFVEDCAVGPEPLVKFVRAMQELLRQHGTEAAFYAHASVGVLHIRPLLDVEDAQDRQRMREISQQTYDLVRSLGGSMSGEHGDGLARGRYVAQQYGPELMEAFRQVKRAFDPAGLMNPGQFFHAQEVTENLRPPSRFVPVPILDWDLKEAVEQCNGQGVCRKLERGTMCPSYMITRDEEHSTRGRANLLRAALAGELPLTSPRMFEALDLCLECKGCRAECPSSVDMARLKLEFLGHYYRDHRPSLRTLMFGHADVLYGLGAAFAPLSNWVARTTWPLLAKLIHLAPQRHPPAFRRARLQTRRRNGREVALLVDTFARTTHPEIAQAAIDVLEAAGFRVHLIQDVCCGRPALSKGLIAHARTLATRTTRRLQPYLQRDIPVIGLEPSCILSLRDEYPALIGSRACGVTFEEFLQDKPIPLQAGPPAILLHGHCHQKALVGTGPAHRLLRQLTGTKITEVDSGCCGMAGSFGYEREHFEISRQLAERRLLPAAREAQTVVAAGISCRQQLADLAGVKSFHPAQVLAAHLKKGG